MKHLIIPNPKEKSQTKQKIFTLSLYELLTNQFYNDEVKIYYNGIVDDYYFDIIWTFVPEVIYKKKTIFVDKKSLYYYIYCNKKLPIYDVIPTIGVTYLGMIESPRCLELLNNSEFTSASFGTTNYSKQLRSHLDGKLLTYDSSLLIAQQSQSILIDKGGINHQLVLSLALGKLVFIDQMCDPNRGLSFDNWHYVRTSEEIAIKLKNIPINQYELQNRVKSDLWQKIELMRLRPLNYI